jgi:L-malate glycosyltransferase
MNEPQKRVMVFAHDASLYGASLSLLPILEHLSKDRSCRLLVILPRHGKFEKRLDELKINYKIVPFLPCISMQSDSIFGKSYTIVEYYIREFASIHLLKSIAVRFQPEVIYTNTSIVTVGYNLAKQLRIPHIWHIREYGDLDHLFQYFPSRQQVAQKIQDSDQSIFITNSLRKYWVNSEQPKYRVIYTGVTSQNSTEVLPRRPGKVHKFGLLGVIASKKGQEVALQGFSAILKDFPQCELHFYGDCDYPEYLRYLKKLATDLRCMERVRFHPYIEDNRLIYDDLTVLLCCSVSEAFGRTIAEAMSHGIPVIANANAGPAEIIEDGINGLLYDRTPEDLAKKMISLVSDPLLYEKISRTAILKSRIDFSLERYVTEVVSIIKNPVSN